jgi:hypothetical protein
MAVGGSTCGAKLGGAKNNNKKYGGNANPEPGAMVSHEAGYVQSGIGGGKRPVKRVVKPVAKRVVKRVVKRGGNANDGMSENPNEMPQSNEMPHQSSEMPHQSSEIPHQSSEMPHQLPEYTGGRNKYAKRGGNADGMPKALGGAKKRALTPYNKFVKKHFPAMKVKYPDYKAPQIMKKIADEWKKTK